MNQKYSKAGIYSWLFVLTIVSVIGVSCSEEPGLVGSGFISNEEEIQVDTVFFSSVLPETGAAYFSGRSSRIPIGNYDDPVFGKITSTGYFKPTIDKNEFFFFVDADANVELELVFDTLNAYGQLNSADMFNLQRVNSLWRGIAMKATDDIAIDEEIVTDFSTTSPSRVRVPVPKEWVVEFAQLFNQDDSIRDSLFIFDFNGLAIVPDELITNKILFINPGQSKLLINNPGEADINEVFFGDWGFTITRENAPSFPNRIVVNGTNESVLNVSFFEELNSFRNSNIIRVELILYEDDTTLFDDLPAGETRTRAAFLESHLGIRFDKDFEFTFGTGDSVGVRLPDTFAYRFNLTRYVNEFFFGTTRANNFFITILDRQGLLPSTLIYGPNAERAVRPRLIVTTLKD